MSYKTYLRFAKKYLFKHNAMPEYVTFFVTNRCNAGCEHCFYADSLNKDVDELKLGEINKISENMGDFSHLLISGGEPHLREDLCNIIGIFYRNNNIQSATIPSNGILTETIVRNVREILENCKGLSLVTPVSIDAFGEDHDAIRNFKGCFDKDIKTYKELEEFKSRYPNFGNKVSITLSSFNQNNIKRTYFSIMEELKPDSVGFNLARGLPRNPDSTNVDIKYYEEIVSIMKKDLILRRCKSSSGHKIFLLDFITANDLIKKEQIIYMVKHKKYISRCYAGILNAVIYPNGDVFPCEILNKKIGNLRDYNYDFKKLWESEKAKEIREFIGTSKCFCTHECNLNTNILFNPRYLPHLVYYSFKLFFN